MGKLVNIKKSHAERIVLAVREVSMVTYRQLLEAVNTVQAHEEAMRLCYLNGFETEASREDIEHVYDLETQESGGLVD